MKYILYCRKSTDTEDKQVQSLESQESELTKLAASQNLNVILTLKEKMSAKSEGRPMFNDMLKMIRAGKADAILCWKMDRLARNFIDGGRVIDLLQRGTIKEIRTFEATHLPSDNVLMLAMHFGMANQYIRDLSTNVKRGIRTKLEKGIWANRAPLGYLNDKVEKTILLDATIAPYIRRTFELYATGSYSILDVSNTLYKEGLRTPSGKKVYRGMIYRILNNPFYSGVMRMDGKLYAGNHEPIISKSLYDDAQYVLSGKSRSCTQKLFFPLRGFMHCGACGCLLTATLKKGHHYYYCTNGRFSCSEHKSYLRETYLYEKVASLFDDLVFTDRKIELMYKAAKEEMERTGGETAHALQSLKNRLQALPARESRLLDAFVADQISKDLYDQKVETLKHERFDIEKQTSELEAGQTVRTLEPTKAVFLEASRAKHEFLEGNDMKKRAIVEKLLWNLNIKDRNIQEVRYKTPFNIIAKTPKDASFLQLRRGRDSNSRGPFDPAGFRNRCFRPLSHLSVFAGY